MNTAEAGRLLMHASAFDNRQPSEAAAQAWATALHDLPLDPDALDAVARYYGTPPKEPGQRLWIQPHDVRTLRKTIRAERLDGFIYEPPPGDRDPHYLERLRSQRAAIASSQTPAPTDHPALEGPPHQTVADAIAGVGHEVPSEDEPEEPAGKRGPLGVQCPKCRARIGYHCRWPGGARRSTHPARVRLAEGEPTVTPGAEQEAEARRAAAAAALDRLTPQQRAELEAFQQRMSDAS